MYRGVLRHLLIISSFASGAVIITRCHQPTPLAGNWPALWAAAARDHSHAGLIWNEATRGNLREALQREEAALQARRTRVAQVRGVAFVCSFARRCSFPLLVSPGCMLV